MEIIEISSRKWIVSNIPSKNYKEIIREFMKSLNCACHVEEAGWRATTPLTFGCTIVEDF